MNPPQVVRQSANRSRKFAVTINQPDDGEIRTQGDILYACEQAKPSIGFCVGQLERGADNGRLHWQLYFETTVRMPWLAFKQILGFPEAHVEICHASQEANIAYCTKQSTRAVEFGDTFFEWGKKMEQGKRSDIEDSVDMLSNGRPMEEVLDAHPGTFVRYHRGLREAANLKRSRPVRPRHVTVYFGPTGTGKTETAFGTGEDTFVYSPGVMNAWFDGYDGEGRIVFDEFRGQITWAHLLSITDKYPVRVQVKGSSVMVMADTLIFTSPCHPVNWYPSKLASRDNVAQLRRRVDRIVQCDVSTPSNSDGHKDVTDVPWEDFREVNEVNPQQQFDQFFH